MPLIPIVIFALATRPEWLLIYIIAYLLIQLLESNVITPYIVKSELDIPSGALLVFQLIAATIFGALGLLLAVPMLAICITLVRELYSKDLLQLQENSIGVLSTPGNPLRLVRPQVEFEKKNLKNKTSAQRES
ncbi:AI-2E family transporter [Chloroflexi bacterium TSY]|nr:AI-2E family transporter [Chloroflexi bacterium TSY]